MTETEVDPYAGIKKFRTFLIVLLVAFIVVSAAYNMVTLNFLRRPIEDALGGHVNVRGDVKLGTEGLRPTLVIHDLVAGDITLGNVEMLIPFDKPAPGNTVETHVKLTALTFPGRPPINIDIPAKSDSIDSSIDNFEARAGETLLKGNLSYKPGAVAANADVTALDYGLLYPGGSGGAGTGTLTLTGQGANQHLIVSTLQGHLLLTGGKGAIPGRALALWGGSVLGALLTPAATVNCAVAELDITGGVATVKRLAVDTDVMNITGTGSIDLNTSYMNMTFTPQPKQAGAMATAVPILVSGPLGHAVGEPVGLPVAAAPNAPSPCGAAP
jgi:uncharacterized protein involved in outer membrane biogenesis